jgi:fermentation-respiration switch protein FrsA (DUF1100 family)
VHEDTSFEGFDGTRLRGRLYRPEDGSPPWPAAVLTNGFSATVAMGLEVHARALTRSGIAALVYDHRHLGRSDGDRRGEVNPWAQMRDLRCALDRLRSCPDVDAERIGIAGLSFSAGEALIVAACDERVRAVAGVVPFAGFDAVDYADCGPRFAALRAAVLDTSPRALSVAVRVDSGPIAVVAEPGDPRRAYLPHPEAAAWFLGAGRALDPGWRNEVRVVNAYRTDPPFDPGVCTPFLAPRPVLLVVATQDRLAPTAAALAAAERAGPGCRTELLEGDHFAAFRPPGRERAARALGAFFATALVGSRPPG